MTKLMNVEHVRNPSDAHQNGQTEKSSQIRKPFAHFLFEAHHIVIHFSIQNDAIFVRMFSLFSRMMLCNIGSEMAI